MASPLDMSLEDIIKKNKKPGGAAGGRGRGRGSGPSGGAGAGPARRIPNRLANRSVPYSVGKAPDTIWRHDMYKTPAQMGGFPSSVAPRASAIETGIKLYISNLDYGVSNEDIKELFSEVGELKRYSINYDRSGRSKGTAEVVFARRADAMAAISRYNDVQLDGKPMKIELVVPDVPAPLPSQLPAPYVANGNYGNPNGFSKSGSGRGSTGWSRGGGRGRGRGRARGKGRGEPVSVDALDADLDKYHSEVMETN